MKIYKILHSPIILPIIFFIFVIILGSIFLHSFDNSKTQTITWVDSIFTATSATCVTGLSVVDTSTYFTIYGKIIILLLMQIGGLGIMTFTSLSIYLWTRRTTITDRIAVGQILLHDPKFNLGKFLIEIVSWTFIIEFIGALLLYSLDPIDFSPFSAFFHSVSAFCNAGFSLFSNSLVKWKGSLSINFVFMALIILGGIGFSVFIELKYCLITCIKMRSFHSFKKLSWYSKIVIKTTIILIITGWISIYISEYVGYNRIMSMEDALLTSLFQSVTSRTAGFNTLNIARMTNVSLVIILVLMFIGGASGSCAGGIKITTFRIIVASIWSELKGKRQTIVGKFAVEETVVKKAMVLFILSIIIISIAVFFLDYTEGGDKPHYMIRGQFLEIVFEVVSAYCTVGLSTGLTSSLTIYGKWTIILLMFIGRLGPFMLISVLQNIQEVQYYKYPEEKIMIG